MNSESCVMENTLSQEELTTTDDACVTQFIEIVPINTARNEFDTFAVREVKEEIVVKDEILVDIKQEHEEICGEYGAQISSAITVRLR